MNLIIQKVTTISTHCFLGCFPKMFQSSQVRDYTGCGILNVAPFSQSCSLISNSACGDLQPYRVIRVLAPLLDVRQNLNQILFQQFIIKANIYGDNSTFFSTSQKTRYGYVIKM